MSEPLSRKKFITKLDAYPTSDDSFVYRQLLVHDAALREQLATARREVWEEAAHAFDKKFYATDRRLDNTRDYRVDEFYKYCRSQAQKEAP